MNSYELMENHEFMYEFMKKKYNLGTKKCPVKKFFSYMNSNVNSYMSSHMKAKSMNSYMNLHMN